MYVCEEESEEHPVKTFHPGLAVYYIREQRKADSKEKGLNA
jgi:hypothetical protein